MQIERSAGVPDLVRDVIDIVRERGIQLELDGGTATLTIDGAEHHRPWFVCRREGHALPAPTRGSSEALVLTERLSQAEAERLQRRGIWYADRAGRLHIRAPGVFILLDGGARAPRRGRSAVPKAQNLMSPARAQVVCCLLAWPHLLHVPVRELARHAGASVGIAQQVLATLRTDRFLTAGSERLIQVDKLLDQWAGAFRWGLGRRLELGRFAGSPAVEAWVARGHLVHISGEAAVRDELHGDGLTLYVATMDVQAAIASRWRRPEHEHGGNIAVRRRFWTDPDHPEPLGETGEVQTAPLPLVYADLVNSSDPRLMAVAEPLKEQVVGLHAR